ncbi:hypothetical protein AgCh_027258 [Apium graveolens]
MEQNMLLVMVITWSLVPFFLAKTFYSIWWKPKRLDKYLKLQGINGTSYKPLLGDLKEYVKQIQDAWAKPGSLNHRIVSRVDPFTHNLVQKYGNRYEVSSVMNIMDPELVKEVLSNKLGHFQKPSLNPLILILTNGLTTLEGEKWAAHRRIMSPAFHLEKLKGMVPVFTDSCMMLVDRWNKLAGTQRTCEIDVWTEFQDLTGDIISRTAFGSSYEEGKKILKLQKELQVLVMEAMQTLYIPGFRTLVENKDRAITAGESRNDDLLGLLLQSSKQINPINNSSGAHSNQMTVEDIIEECKLFYLAGHETTSSWLTWIIVVLAMHQDWQEKAREEVLRVTMILYEVQRLYSPVIALYLQTSKETEIGDIIIPAAVDITLPLLHIHHDPALWGDDAEEFKPERFSEGVAKASKDKLAFFPFGWGPRMCIGNHFATIEVKVALAVILQNFSFELSPSYTHAPHTVMTLQPQHGAQITFNQL